MVWVDAVLPTTRGAIPPRPTPPKDKEFT